MAIANRRLAGCLGKRVIVNDVDEDVVRRWSEEDGPVLLVNLSGVLELHRSVEAYVGSETGRAATNTYECPNRTAMVCIAGCPDLSSVSVHHVPSGARLGGNSVGVTYTDPVHTACFRNDTIWRNAMTTRFCELQGHALGRGALKHEPTEAHRVLLTRDLGLSDQQEQLLRNGTPEIKRWRRCRAA